LIVARHAGCDTTILLRLFGSKQALFAEIPEGTFSLEPAFEGPTERLGVRVA
jgi:hypothetical protein